MLQSIQKHIQGWVAGTIIAIISVTFALWGIQYYIGGHSGDGKAVVKLAGTKITVKQFSHYYRQVINAQPKYAALHGAAKQILQQQILAEMIQKQALLSALKKDGFNISTQQVRGAILQEPWFQENGQFSKQRFQQLLYANSISEAQYVEQLQSQLMTAQLKMGLQDTSIVLPNEIKQSYKLLNQTRSFGYFIIPAHLFGAKITPTAAQLQAYYKGHPQQFMLPEQVSIQYIILSPKKMAAAVPVSDQQIKDFYAENKGHFLTPRRWMVADISDKSLGSDGIALPGSTQSLQAVSQALKSGKSFTSYKSSKHWVSSADKQQAALTKILMKMKPGQVSDVVQVNGQGHIVKLVAIQDPEQQPLSAVKQKVKQTIQNQKAQSEFSDAADQLSNLTYTTPNSLAPAAKALNLKVQISSLFTQQGGSGIAANKEIIATAFNPDTLQSGNNSTPINLNDGSMVVLRINKHVDQHVQPFKDAKAEVVASVKSELANQKAGALAQKLKQQLAQGAKPLDLAKKYKLIWNQKNKVVHSNTTVPATVMNKVFFMSLDSKDKANNLAIVPFKNSDMALLELLAVQLPTKESITAKQRSSLIKTIGLFSGQLDYQLFNKTAIDQAEVKIDEDTLKRIS
ncbi:MAG: SurA N-terminal domain-containing protein [Coxiellaceae bacterium]|nr:SurA N-terminal domain-containing protein [Coxiellaceae bacterium]